VDAVIVGRKTYDKVLSMGFDFPHADKEAYGIDQAAASGSFPITFNTPQRISTPAIIPTTG
jgi:dihydrofolate reductase